MFDKYFKDLKENLDTNYVYAVRHFWDGRIVGPNNAKTTGDILIKCKQCKKSDNTKFTFDMCGTKVSLNDIKKISSYRTAHGFKLDKHVGKSLYSWTSFFTSHTDAVLYVKSKYWGYLDD